MRRLFDGETGAIRDNVILNTAAALVVCEKVNSLKEGIKLAQMNIDSGLAQKKLKSLSDQYECFEDHMLKEIRRGKFFKKTSYF